jgi:DNA-binding CsgD family transcriptional regulator
METLLSGDHGPLGQLQRASSLDEYHQACMDYAQQNGFANYTLVKLDLRFKQAPPATLFTNKHFKVSTLFRTQSYNQYKAALEISQRQTTPFVELCYKSKNQQFLPVLDYYQKQDRFNSSTFSDIRFYFPFHMRYQHSGFLMLSGSTKVTFAGQDYCSHGKLFADYLVDKISHLQSTKQRHPQIRLTNKESQCLYLLADGYSYEEIGKALGIAADTVNYHIRKITNKFGARNRFHAIALAISENQTPPQL